jgi:hypothetical protein
LRAGEQRIMSAPFRDEDNKPGPVAVAPAPAQ